MNITALPRSVSVLRSQIVPHLARVSRGRITSIDEVTAVLHLAADRVLKLTPLSDEDCEALHDQIDKLAHFVEHGTESASLTLRVGAETFTAELAS